MQKSQSFKENIDEEFPEYLKITYSECPGYSTWKQLFRNQIQIPIDLFILQYAIHNEIDQEKSNKIAQAIDRDKNQKISFEEFMAFITYYLVYYDQNGSRVKQIDIFTQRLIKDQEKQYQEQIVSGKIIYIDGAIYQGDLQGVRQGTGKTISNDQTTYEGEYQNDKRHGKGILSKLNSVYNGSWVENQKTNGRLTWKDGSYYEGGFNLDAFEGEGKLISTDGTIYQGQFIKGYMIEGKIQYPNGELYEGQTKNSKIKHGLGKMFNAQGQVTYDGNFYNDKPSNLYHYTNVEDLVKIESNQQQIEGLEIEISNVQGHNGKMLSNLNNLKILQIKFLNTSTAHDNIQLVYELLLNVHPDAFKNMQELSIYISTDQQQQIIIQDIRDIFNSIIKFPNITFLGLSLESLGASNQNVDASIIDHLVQTLMTFKNLTGLRLNLYEWGYQNANLKNEQIIAILSVISQYNENQFTYLHIDLGRWGVDTYESLNIINDTSVNAFADLIKKFKYLEFLKVNFRSWNYKSNLVTDDAIVNLSQQLGNLTQLVILEFNWRSMTFMNCITDKSCSSLEIAISKLIKLEKLLLELEYCNPWFFKDIKKVVNNLPKLQFNDILF